MRYPFDCDELKKGDVVEARFIEGLYRVDRGTDGFRRALLQAREFIKAEFLRRGEIVEVKERKGDLLILTTEQAATYTSDRYRSHFRGAGHAHARKSALPREELSPDSLEIHDRQLAIQGRMLAAARAARAQKDRVIAPVPRRKQLPPR